MSSTHDEQIPKSSLKFDFLAKGYLVPIWHIYSGSNEIELNEIRRLAIEQLKRTIAETREVPYDQVSLKDLKFVFEQ